MQEIPTIRNMFKSMASTGDEFTELMMPSNLYTAVYEINVVGVHIQLVSFIWDIVCL